MTPTLVMLNVLREAPSVTAVLGDRIHVEDAPAGTEGAYALVRPSGGDRMYALAKVTGHQVARMKVFVYDATFKTADEVADAIETSLVDIRTKAGGMRIVICSEGVGVSDMMDEPKRYRRTMQFEMHLSRCATKF